MAATLHDQPGFPRDGDAVTCVEASAARDPHTFSTRDTDGTARAGSRALAVATPNVDSTTNCVVVASVSSKYIDSATGAFVSIPNIEADATSSPIRGSARLNRDRTRVAILRRLRLQHHLSTEAARPSRNRNIATHGAQAVEIREATITALNDNGPTCLVLVRGLTSRQIQRTTGSPGTLTNLKANISTGTVRRRASLEGHGARVAGGGGAR